MTLLETGDLDSVAHDCVDESDLSVLECDYLRWVTGVCIRMCARDLILTKQRELGDGSFVLTIDNYLDWVDEISRLIYCKLLLSFKQFQELDQSRAIEISHDKVAGILRYLIVRDRI